MAKSVRSALFGALLVALLALPTGALAQSGANSSGSPGLTSAPPARASAPHRAKPPTAVSRSHPQPARPSAAIAASFPASSSPSRSGTSLAHTGFDAATLAVVGAALLLAGLGLRLGLRTVDVPRF